MEIHWTSAYVLSFLILLVGIFFLGYREPEMIKNEPSYGAKEEPKEETGSTKRKKIFVDEQKSNHLHSSDLLRVMQYNVLAKGYASAERYYYCPSEALGWNYRGKQLIQEILEHAPDIALLQEVDHFEYFEKFLPMHGLFTQRAHHSDGCAMFFNAERLKLIDHEEIQFNLIAQVTRNNSRRFRKDNVASIALFETWQKIYVCVATIHSYWDPEFADLKLVQSHKLLAKIARFLQRHSLPMVSTPVIVGGDFNSLPNSSVYQLYSSGLVSCKESSQIISQSIPASHIDLKSLSRKQNFATKLKLKSAYSVLGEPHSNLTPWFNGTIDYIWYSEQLKLVSVMSPPSVEGEGLPSTLWPSDHLSLICELDLKVTAT